MFDTIKFSSFYPKAGHWLLLFYLLIFHPMPAQAQGGQGSTAGGWTPPGMAPGAPAGSYPLSGFEQINPFNGNMNVSIPLVQVGGRGEAGYTIPLRISPDPWIIDTQEYSVYNSFRQDYDYFWAHYPSHSWWSVVNVGYGPGLMQVRQSGGNVGQLAAGDYVYNSTLTKLTFTASDGTEYEFIDQASEGAIGGGANARGRVWTTHNGGISATFISDNSLAMVRTLFRREKQTGSTS